MNSVFSINPESNNMPEPEFKPFKLELLDRPDSELGKFYKKDGPPVNEDFKVDFKTFNENDPDLSSYSTDILTGYGRSVLVADMQDSNIPTGDIHKVEYANGVNEAGHEAFVYKPKSEKEIAKDIKNANPNKWTIIQAMNPQHKPVGFVVRGDEQPSLHPSQIIGRHLSTLPDSIQEPNSVARLDLSDDPKWPRDSKGNINRKLVVENQLQPLLNQVNNLDQLVPQGYRVIKNVDKNRIEIVNTVDRTAGKLMFEFDGQALYGTPMGQLRKTRLQYNGVDRVLDLASKDHFEGVILFLRPAKVLKAPTPEPPVSQRRARAMDILTNGNVLPSSGEVFNMPDNTPNINVSPRRAHAMEVLNNGNTLPSSGEIFILPDNAVKKPYINGSTNGHVAEDILSKTEKIVSVEKQDKLEEALRRIVESKKDLDGMDIVIDEFNNLYPKLAKKGSTEKDRIRNAYGFVITLIGATTAIPPETKNELLSQISAHMMIGDGRKQVVKEVRKIESEEVVG